MVWILIGFALITLMDLTPLLRRRKGRAVAAFLTVLAAALTLSVLQALHIEVPSTMAAWQALLQGLGLSYPP